MRCDTLSIDSCGGWASEQGSSRQHEDSKGSSAVLTTIGSEARPPKPPAYLAEILAHYPSSPWEVRYYLGGDIDISMREIFRSGNMESQLRILISRGLNVRSTFETKNV